MAIHSQAEFCKLAYLDSKYFKQEVARGRIVQNKDGTITDTLDRNIVYLKLRKDKYGSRVLDSTPVFLPEQPIKPKVRKVKDDIESEPRRNDLYNIELEQKELNLKKTKLEVELKEIDIQKKLGKLIPLELVKPVISALTHAMVTEFRNYIDDRDRIMSKKYNIPGSEVAENKGLLTKGFNKAQEKAVAAVDRKIAQIAAEFSETKGVGEHG